ncbi:MAG: hypothetical protein CMI55_04025 [Parcubacteria group bacterium]|jgi:4-amino-4-deoxy-L-arabinose transferase-like glycosyltransferase|nr:hypothetical protein [Parcubacteria group bacterium]|tara:strand:- start:12361 stop:13995 length:1635 start_codon:yes stop_codon:yes gene_type:complete
MEAPKKYRIIILLLILVLAGFFRIWQIDSIPPGLYPDEAINGNDALDTLSTNLPAGKAGQFKVFYPENNGREGLFIWLIAFAFKIFGPGIWSLRLVSAIFGILTVLGLYLMTKELFLSGNSDKKSRTFNSPSMIALLSAFFLAISFWHTNFSRIGFRAVLVPFLMCFSFYFLLKAFRKNTTLDYIWAGIFFGLGFYTYIAFRVAVLILGIVLLFKMIEYWQKNKPKKINWPWLWKETYLKTWFKVDIFLLTILIVALPIGLHFFNNPQDFTGRAGGISVFSAEAPIKSLSISAIKTLGMFNFVGDWNWRHNLAGAPMLTWPIGILFIIGLTIIITQIKRQTFKSIFLISWFLIMLLPAVLTFEGIPHALRTIGLIPVIYILAAFGLTKLITKLDLLNKELIWLALILFLLYPAALNFNKYFFKWAQSPELPNAFRHDLVASTNYLKALPNHIQKYVIVNESGVAAPYPDGPPMPIQTMIFVERAANDQQISYLETNQIKQIKSNNAPLIVVSLKYQESIFQELSKRLPQGGIRHINGFTAYEIK